MEALQYYIIINGGLGTDDDKPTSFAVVAGVTIDARTVVGTVCVVTSSSIHARKSQTFVDVCEINTT